MSNDSGKKPTEKILEWFRKSSDVQIKKYKIQFLYQILQRNAIQHLKIQVKAQHLNIEINVDFTQKDNKVLECKMQFKREQ